MPRTSRRLFLQTAAVGAVTFSVTASSYARIKGVLPLSIVGEIGLRLSTRIGYSQIWPHKIPLGQNGLQVTLQEGVEDQSPTVDCVST